MYKAAKEIFAPKEKIDPPGKWTHDDLTGKEFGNEYQKWNGEMWRKIFTCFKEDAVRYMSFASFLDKDYCAPINAWSLKNWTGIQKWHESLANYKDVSFLDFLIKFYSAPTPKE